MVKSRGTLFVGDKQVDNLWITLGFILLKGSEVFWKSFEGGSIDEGKQKQRTSVR
jgi:hypothetical protein